MTVDSGVAAVDRALGLLAAFNVADYSLSLAEIAQRTGMYKSTILRLAESLQKSGYLKRLDDGTFQVGPEPLRLGAIYQRQCRTSEHVPQVLRAVCKATNECASFYIRDASFAICLHRVDSPRVIRDAIREGDRLPIDKGAAAHVLRAFSGEDGEKYERIRRELFCASFGESDPEIAAVSVPVLGVERRFIGALTISGPRYRLEDGGTQRVLPALFEGARTLAAVFGGRAEWYALP